jgi:hypothetical protein
VDAHSKSSRRWYTIYEQAIWRTTNRGEILFVSGGLAFSHYDSAECVLLSHELPKPPTAAEAPFVLDLCLYWSRYRTILRS